MENNFDCCGKRSTELLVHSDDGNTQWVYACDVCKRKFDKTIYDMGLGKLEAVI